MDLFHSYSGTDSSDSASHHQEQEIKSRKRHYEDEHTASTSDDSDGSSGSETHATASHPPVKKKKTNDDGSSIRLADKGSYSSVAAKMMQKMGYKEGKGLGVKGQGRVDIVEASKQKGKRGLGLKLKTDEIDVVINWEDEKAPSSAEEVKWIPPSNEAVPIYEELCEWTIKDKKKLVIDDEDTFCDGKLLKTLLKCKSVFDDLEGPEMRKARTRSNPYETIRGAFFLNRAAMKMANMDHVFDRMFTQPKNLHPHDTLFFADICAGPGGFSEYVLWRKGFKAKGFGFTLKGNNDFKLEMFFAAHSEFFEPTYGVGGVNGDGDIMNGDNLEAFQTFVLNNTCDKGVHFVMADGGFSVEGQENIQEILTKQLLLCQFACALSILRLDGCFVCKTFDLFTPFSVSLIYLLRRVFEEVCIFKPVTSRPANSERYVVCKGYRDEERLLADYMIAANQELNDMKHTQEDISMLVPLEILLEDQEFVNYMKTSNEDIATQQCKALAKIHDFSKDSTKIELTQNLIREECLKRWDIPDKIRSAPPKMSVEQTFNSITGLTSAAQFCNNAIVLRRENMDKLKQIYDYRCYVCGSRKRAIILSLGGARVHKWVPNHESRPWQILQGVNLLLPRNTLLDVELVREIKGEGKGQRRKTTVHIIDAYMLAGVDISKKHFTERYEDIRVFVQAVSKPSRTDINEVRVKEMFRTEEIQRVFDRLKMKVIKGQGKVERLCYNITNSDNSFAPTGLCFIKIVKEPWTMSYSKSQRKKYFYNTRTRQSTFECPNDFSVPFSYCCTHRMIWLFEEGVKVHPKQEHTKQGAIASDLITQFIASKSHP